MRMLSAGVILGIGLGGFADGIVLHQIMQWLFLAIAGVGFIVAGRLLMGTRARTR